MPTLDETIALVTDLYDGVVDLNDVPYIEHVLWVMRALPKDATEDDRHLAVLHDAIELCRPRLAKLMEAMNMQFDHASPMAYLRFFHQRGYSQYVIDGLMLLTREMWSGWSYMNYITNIIDSGHRGAMLVKYFDNVYNSEPDRLANALPAYQAWVPSLQVRYQRSKQALSTALGIH